MISDLLPLLAQGGVDDPTPEELADILWLAQRVLPPGRAPGGTGDPSSTERAHPSATEEQAEDAPEDTTTQQDWDESAVDQEALGVHVPGSDAHDGTVGTTGTPVRVPAAASLPHALALVRSLKPLTRKVPSRTVFELDEDATVTRLVDEGILLPVLRPAPSRWLRLALVVDCGPSMSLWQDEVHEIQHEVARLGAFRDIRRWNLSPSTDGTTVDLRPHPAANRPPRHPREIIDPAGDQLILVLTDTVGAIWRTGAAHRLLLDWTRHSQVALAHMLPAALWNRAGTPPAPTLMHIPQPGLPNAQWKVVPPEQHRLRRGGGSIPIPVVELEPGPLRAWAEMTAGNGRWTTSAALLLPARPPSRTSRGPTRRSSSTPVAVPADAAIRRFRASSSPRAWRLAGLLSALSTVTIPVARLVQRAMLPGSSRSDLAEVFLGGLLRRTAEPEGLPYRGDLRFDFLPEIRDALVGAQYRDDVKEVRELVRTQITEYLKPRYGSPRSVKGALTGASPQHVTVPAESEAFATATRADLARMGASVAPTRSPDEPADPPSAPAETVCVSYAGPDRAWAEWVGWQLESAGYRVELDIRMPSGADWVAWLDAALRNAGIVVALLSKAYLRREWTEREWSAALGIRPPRLLPLEIEPLTSTDIPAPLAVLLRRQLHTLDEPTAVTTLLEAVGGPARSTRTPPTRAPRPQTPPRLPSSSRPRLLRKLPPRNPGFVGREDLLDRLRDLLLGSRTAAVQALHGVGGVGKSQVALEYAYRFLSQYELVWWIDAEQTDQIYVHYSELAARLGIADPAEGAERNARILLEHLATRDRWLIILDNADDPAGIASLLPSGAGHVLITSRNPAWQGLARGVSLDVFSRADSRGYLAEHIPALALEEADTLARELGDLPLALAQATGVISSGMPVQRYLALLRDQRSRVLNLAVPPDYPVSLAGTVAIAAQRLAAEQPSAASLLRLGSFFGPEPIPVDWLMSAQGRLSTVRVPADDVLWPQTALMPLTRYGLARTSHDTFQIHRLTQAIQRDRTSEAEAAAVRSDVDTVLSGVTPGDPELPESWDGWAVLTSHLTTRPGPFEDDQYALRGTLFGAARYLLSSGRPREALRVCTEFHELWSHSLGEDHPGTLVWAAYRGEAAAAVGEPEEARRVAEDVLDRRRRVLGEDHPDTLRSGQNLATSLAHVGAYEEARRLAEDVLDRRRRVLGEDHPDTLASANTLAVILRDLGAHEEARRLAEEVVQRESGVLGEDHPYTLASAHNLAVILGDLGAYEEARRVAEDVLDRRRRVLGEDHPDTLASANTLAATLSGLQEYAEARRLYERVLEWGRRSLGDDHQATLAAAHNLAITLYRLRSYQESEALFKDALIRSRRVLGDDHPGTERIVEGLGAVLMALGKNYQAQRLLASRSKRPAAGRRPSVPTEDD
ncbi:FxSxx-COOH system tetratricopeptide repeat protein [Streptomyces sp. NPDC008222]|uniref:FxSxx-COOH system tetratricopeptide repeat protein n=1 Tax=Streptomyces sp. NPDC008222 TaxID=3364820 RepID=UPI0036E61410